jgi:SAM-dependent methyltransferase
VRPISGDPGRLPSPPPPPPPARPSIPEPPDLSTLTRTARVQELRPTKPRSHAWWELFFDDDYLRTVRAPTRQQIAKQCDFIEKRLGLKPGATLLDVACGLGQHVVELTARGYASVGVDLSLAMLSRASEEAQARGMRINFLHADMRDLSFESNFDAVTCLGTSLGYFDDETNRKVMERLLRALKPGGVLLLDVVNRDHVIRSQPNLIWFEGDGCVCMEESEFNFFTSRLHVKRTVILDNGRQLENEYSLRLYSLHELGQLLNASGFRVSEVSGRDALPGVFFGQESPNLMIVAERRPDSASGTSGDG